MSESRTVALYTGGHRGAEACFRETAEKQNLREQIYNFEGHEISRERRRRDVVEQRAGSGHRRFGDYAKMHGTFLRNGTHHVADLSASVSCPECRDQFFCADWVLSNDIVEGSTSGRARPLVPCGTTE